MRRLVQQVLESVNPALLPPAQIIQGSNLTEQPPFPFLVHKLTITNPTPSRGGRPGLEVWCYDEPGSYLRIDAILQAIRARLAPGPHVLADGSELIAVVDWTNDSTDLPAEEFHGITRMSAYNLVGRPA